MADCRSRHTFRNWSRTLKFEVHQFCKPKTEARIVEIVKQARGAGGCVRTQGAGHSFSQLLPTDDTLISLDDLGGDIHVQGTRVRAPAGMRLKDLIGRLADVGLAVQNMGSVTEQSIAGAISTGTHGTGLSLGSMSTQVVGVKLITGNGDVVSFAEADAELRAARLSLGALGILTEVTLDCVPHYQIEYNAYVGQFDHVMANLDALKAENERVLLWWLVPFFDRDEVIVITKNPPGTPAGILGGAQDRVVHPFGIRNAPLGKGADELWMFIAAQGAGGSSGFRRVWHMEGDYDEMLTLPLLPIFHTECEYAIPHAHSVKALQAFRAVVEENDFKLKLPIEVRFTAGDDILLSPGNNGPVCYVGASTEDNTAEVFARFEPLMRTFEGRPHWGKHFTLTRKDIQGMYPATYDSFVDLRNALDPDKVFSNSLLRELLG